MADSDIQNLQSGPGGPGRAKVGHGPLSKANSLCGKEFKSGPPFPGEKEGKKEKTQTLIQRYLEQERISGCRERTLEGLRLQLPRLLEYLREADLPVEAVGVTEAQGFLNRLIEGGKKAGGSYSKGSLQNFTTAAIGFWDFLKKRGIVLSNPFRDIPRVRVQRSLPRSILKEHEMDRLLAELSCFHLQGGLRSGKRRYLMHVAAELMYATGLRISEVASLRVEDIEFERGIIHVREGKGGRSRVAYLNEYARRLLELYVGRMRPSMFSGRRKLPTLFGVRTAALRDSLNEALKEATAALGCSTMSSHGFRHAVGFHLLRAGCDIRFIQAILGHRRLQSTEVYTKVDKTDLKRILDNYHPRRFGKPGGKADEKPEGGSGD